MRLAVFIVGKAEWDLQRTKCLGCDRLAKMQVISNALQALRVPR
jgi:hypothetical protein